MVDLSHARRGELFVAHLMLPHSPYIYDADCRLLPLDQWRERRTVMTAETRTELYARYARQLSCTTRLVRQMLDAIPEEVRSDSIVIVQGDHGSRLALANPPLPEGKEMTAEDYRDTQLALFAVRSPWLEAGDDDRFSPITCIFKSLVDGAFRSFPGLDACSQAPRVFVAATGNRIVRKPLPVLAGRLPFPR
jgi:hypothetical protein